MDALLITVVLAVTQPSTCPLIDPSRPAQFIVFDKLGEGDAPAGESRQRVWLRLRNNTRCDLRFPRGLGRECDGADAAQFADGACVRLAYDQFDGGSGSPYPWSVTDPAWQAVGPATRAVLAPGTSIVFTVPQSIFVDPQRMIGVPVADLSGASGKYSGSQRHVMFGRGDIPMEIRAQLKK